MKNVKIKSASAHKTKANMAISPVVKSTSCQLL